MGVLCAVSGLQVMDFSASGESFSIRHTGKGLPYSPKLLLEYDYSIIHSVKDDPNHSESYIRGLFRGIAVIGPIAARLAECRMF